MKQLLCNDIGLQKAMQSIRITEQNSVVRVLSLAADSADHLHATCTSDASSFRVVILIARQSLC